jgi:hypothetical protein
VKQRLALATAAEHVAFVAVAAQLSGGSSRYGRVTRRTVTFMDLLEHVNPTGAL